MAEIDRMIAIHGIIPWYFLRRPNRHTANPATRVRGSPVPDVDPGEGIAFILALPVCVDTVTTMGMTVVPLSVAVGGVTVHVASTGTPVQVKVTVPLAPTHPATCRS